MDFPSPRLPVPPILTTSHMQSIVGSAAYTGWTGIATASSAAWTANNKAYYYPFRMTDFGTALKLLFWVGATSSGNIDIGIYDAALNRLVSSGSTAMSATVNTVQAVDITDTVLQPGDYWIGVVCSTTSGTCFAAVNDTDETVLSSMPVYQEALGATTLPAAATPVMSTDASVPVYIVGIQFASAF